VNEQLTFTGDTVATCGGCGDVLTRGTYERYDGDRCRECRAATENEATCDGCDKVLLEGDLYPEAYFFSPWDDDVSSTGLAYCQPCLDSGGGDDDTFYCDGCGRDISTDNGRMTHYRIFNDGEQVCLKCIMDSLLAGGVSNLDDEDILASVIDDGKPWGMFFDRGQLEAEGWTTEEGWTNKLFNDYDADKLASKCKALYEAGRPFIIAYESLSITGGEGYISVYSKPEHALNWYGPPTNNPTDAWDAGVERPS